MPFPLLNLVQLRVFLNLLVMKSFVQINRIKSSLFPAYVSLEKQYLEKNGEKFFVRSGQSVSVNLIVRDKRIISLLTDAIDKAIDSLRGIKS